METQNIKVKCKKCKAYSKTEEPIIIKKFNEKKYYIFGKCAICGKRKNQKANLEQISLFPDEIKEGKEPKIFNNIIEREGKAIHLATLLPLIIAGLTAIPSIADTAKKLFSGSGIEEKQFTYNGKAIDSTTAIQAILSGIQLLPTIVDGVNGIIKWIKGSGLENSQFSESEVRNTIQEMTANGFVFI